MDSIANIQFTSNLWSFLIPLFLMSADIVTGLTYSWVKKKFESKVMRQGLGKKIGEIIALITANVVCYGTNVPDGIALGIAIYIMVMEGLSICENLRKLGIKIPFISNLLKDAEQEIKKPTRKEEKPNEKRNLHESGH